MAGLCSTCPSRTSQPVVLLYVELVSEDSAGWAQHFLRKGLRTKWHGPTSEAGRLGNAV